MILNNEIHKYKIFSISIFLIIELHFSASKKIFMYSSFLCE